MAKLYLRYKESEIPVFFHVFLCLVAYILWIALVLIILPIFIVIQIFSLFGYIFARFFDTGSPLCLGDIPFMLDCELNPYVIVGYMKIKGHLTTPRVIELFQERILNKSDSSASLEKLKQYVTSSFSHYVWKNVKDFKIENYIKEHSQVIEGTREEVHKIFLKMTQEQINLNKSPWKMVVANTLDQQNTFIFCAIHHSVGDGFSLQVIFSNLFDTKPTLITPRITRGLMSCFIQRIFNGIMTGPLAVTTVLFSRYFDNPFYVKNYMDKTDRCFATATCPLSLTVDLKNNYTGSTVNDIFLTCLSTALNRYFIEKGIILTELPIVISFNSRSYKDFINPNQGLKNKSGGTFVSLPMNKNLVDTLSIIKRRTTILKTSSDGHTLSFIFSKIIGLLPKYIGRLAATSLREHCSLLVSNIAGPIEVLSFDKCEVEYFISTPPLMYDLGVSIGFFTYNGNTYITILSVRTVLSDPDKLASYFVEEMEKMHKTL